MKKTFDVMDDKSAILTTSWEGKFKKGRVELNGKLIYEFSGVEDAMTPRQFSLPGGETLLLSLEKRFIGYLWSVNVNDRPVACSETHPQKGLDQAVNVLGFMTVLNIALSALALASDVEMLKDLGMGWFTLGIGFAFWFMHYRAKRGSKIALWSALLVLALDIVLCIALGVIGAGLGVKVMFIYFLYGGIKSIDGLNGVRREQQARAN